jgi:hypothetical protein
MAAPAVILYCDRLTTLSCLRLISLYRTGERRVEPLIRVLDPMPTGWRGVCCRWLLRLGGLRAEEVRFFAGHLKMADGTSAHIAAIRASMDSAVDEGLEIVRRSEDLTALNAAWGRDTVALHCAKALSLAGDDSLYAYALRIQSARALAQREQHAAALCLRSPLRFSAARLQAIAGDLPVSFWGRRLAAAAGKSFALRQRVRAVARRVSAIWLARRHARLIATWEARARERAGLLLVQEADVGMDRSYRFQPHWLLPDAAPTPYDTYILANTPPPRAPHDAAELAAHAVRVISTAEILALSTPVAGDDVAVRLRRDASRSLRAALRAKRPAEAAALGAIARLFNMAAELSGLCRRLRVRTFLASESYLVQADAMQLLAHATDLQTIAFQYSNLASTSPVMLTTADSMLTFAPAARRHWQHRGIAPGEFADIGYTFDSAFAIVAPRARACRDRLRAAGAKFILGYFDETVQASKYGLTGPADHAAELRALLEQVVADPEIGLVTKVQYQRYSPSRISELKDLVRAAEATGRFAELLHGVHRNIILPAEAAQCADLVIGHAVGGTAALEAAMAGARAILLNPYGMSDLNHDAYRQADILFDGMAPALAAIQAHRAGQRPSLGDWAPIRSHFDPFNDGNGGRRIRAAVDRVMSRGAGKLKLAVN